MTPLSMEPVDPGWTWHLDAHYSAAMRVGDLVFVSGQVGITPEGQIAGPDFETQAHQAFANLAAVLAAAGSDLSRVVKVTLLLTNQDDFRFVPALRARYFQAPYPADTTMVVMGLARPGLLVEIEAVGLVAEAYPPGRK